MVCLGNICRSPMAEGALREYFIAQNIDGIVDSAGIIDFHKGDPPDPRAIKAAAKMGIDITNQRSRPVVNSDFKNFDLILSMDESVHNQLIKIAHNDEYKNKIHLFLKFSGSKSDINVTDPYHMPEYVFDIVFRTILDASEKIALKIKADKSGKLYE